MEAIISIFTYLGITHDKILPILIIGIFLYCMSVKFLKPIKTTLGNVKDNILVIATHLSSTARAKLDSNLIKQMSPLTIQPEGLKILEDSGFVTAFNLSGNKEKIFRVIQDRSPKTKLEVENHSIFAFLDLMINDAFLNPIKAYLYQHPDVRDTYPTLAGVYIRDKFLEEHLEIKE